MIAIIPNLDQIIFDHERLMNVVIPLIQDLFHRKGVKVLSVTGRAKTKRSVEQKFKDKGYTDISKMTDVCGIRVVVYFESDVSRVTELIDEMFLIDEENSVNKQDLLKPDQIGYRSVHRICELGKDRSKLPEFEKIGKLKFEVQIRTILQHAWAELSHDSSYKFEGVLPDPIKRKIFLHAGLLEVADAGLSAIAAEIDSYRISLIQKNAVGNFNTAIDSLSLEQYVKNWAEINSFHLEATPDKDSLSELVRELQQFEVMTLKDLAFLIPVGYASLSESFGHYSNIYGVVRDWMLATDWRRFYEQVDYAWGIDVDDDPVLKAILGEQEFMTMAMRINSVAT